MKILARTAALVAVVAVALSGCIRYDVAMTIAEDNTASGTIVIAVQKGIAEQMGTETDAEALDQVFGPRPFGESFVAKDFAEGDWVGKSYSFVAIPITELVDFAEIFTLAREGDELVLSASSAPMTAEEIEQAPPGGQSKLSITFPGEVTEHNGELDGTTVTWDLFAQAEPLHARATVGGADSGLPKGLLIGGGIALALLAAAAVVVVQRRKGTAPAEPLPPSEPLAPSEPPVPSGDGDE